MPVKGRKKPRAPLNAAQQKLVEDAWICVQHVLHDATERFSGTSADFEGEIAERLCSLAPTFDPKKSSLRTWAINQAQYAISDALRAIQPRGFRRKKVEPPRTMSIYTLDSDSTKLRIDAAAPVTRPSLDDQDSIDGVTRGLTLDERTILVDTVIHGRRLKEIGRDFGLCESRMSQVRSAAIQWLQEIRTVNQEGEITCRRAQ